MSHNLLVPHNRNINLWGGLALVCLQPLQLAPCPPQSKPSWPSMRRTCSSMRNLSVRPLSVSPPPAMSSVPSVRSTYLAGSPYGHPIITAWGKAMCAEPIELHGPSVLVLKYM